MGRGKRIGILLQHSVAMLCLHWRGRIFLCVLLTSTGAPKIIMYNLLRYSILNLSETLAQFSLSYYTPYLSLVSASVRSEEVEIV